MKNIFLYSILALGITLSSCQQDNMDDIRPSSTISVDVDELTVFDSPTTLTIESSLAGVTELTLNGVENQDLKLAVADGVATTELKDTDFGPAWAIGESADFTTTIDFGGSQSVSSFGIDVVEALSVSAPSDIQKYDSAVAEVAFVAATMGGVIETLTVERKVVTEADPNPAFTVISSGANVSEFEFIDSIYGVDYGLTDTITYQITATKGAYTEVIDSIYVIITSKSIAASMEAMLSDLEDSLVLDDKSEIAIAFMSANDTRGFISSQVKFAMMDSVINDFSDFVDAVDNATLSDKIDNVVIEDIVAFKYTADSKDYYGYLVVDEVTSLGIGDMENSVSFMYATEPKD